MSGTKEVQPPFFLFVTGRKSMQTLRMSREKKMMNKASNFEAPFSHGHLSLLLGLLGLQPSVLTMWLQSKTLSAPS